MSGWQPPRRRALTVLFVTALALRLAFVYVGRHEPLVSDPLHYSTMAKGLLAGEGYHYGPYRAVWPPAWPFTIAAIYAVSGGEHHGAVRIVTAVLSAGTCLLLVWAVGPWFGAPAALWAGWLMALHPQYVRYPQTFYSEPLYVFCLLAALALLPSALSRRSVARQLATGALLGAASLTRESGLLTLPVLAAWFAVGRGELPAGLARAWVTMVAGTVLVVAPWAARNAIVLHGFAPVTGSNGHNFWCGNNALAYGGPMEPPAEFLGQPELAGDRAQLRAGLAWVRDHPGRAAALWAVKLRRLWGVPRWETDRRGRAEKLFRATQVISYLVLWLLALAAWRRCRAQWRWALLPALLMVAPTFVYVASHSMARHRLGMEQFLIAFAGLGAAGLCGPPRANGEATCRVAPTPTSQPV